MTLLARFRRPAPPAGRHRPDRPNAVPFVFPRDQLGRRIPPIQRRAVGVPVALVLTNARKDTAA